MYKLAGVKWCGGQGERERKGSFKKEKKRMSFAVMT
jgi:hypothetical protein